MPFRIEPGQHAAHWTIARVTEPTDRPTSGLARSQKDYSKNVISVLLFLVNVLINI